MNDSINPTVPESDDCQSSFADQTTIIDDPNDFEFGNMSIDLRNNFALDRLLLKVKKFDSGEDLALKKVNSAFQNPLELALLRRKSINDTFNM
jgi:hypothetical protein